MNNNYSTDGNTLESFVSPYLTQKASTSIQQYQLPSSHQEHSLQLNNPSSSNINSQSTNVKTFNNVNEFIDKICLYFKTSSLKVKLYLNNLFLKIFIIKR
uniref:Uncharacterized protein n=1 Tax=Meloidogyne enterolobii TaxID=390850 RepID=A0A6V7W6N5_MELEN|nr:unnamed protein product [Meloidogyne enterolobii]